MDNRGVGAGIGDEVKKGQCKFQLLGKQCDAKRCQYTRNPLCKAYKDNGRKGCWDGRCRLLHPYDCKSVEGGWVCDDKSCHAWHNKWEYKEWGTPINPSGAWNSGSFQQPPKGFERTPGRKEKVDNNNKGESGGDEGNAQGALKKHGPTLKEKVDKNAETLEVVSKNPERLTQMQSQNQWGNQWGGPDQYRQWGGGYGW